MQNFSNQQVKFVIRAKENRKYEELKLLIQDGQDVDLGELKLLKDSLVHLYTGYPYSINEAINITGKKSWKRLSDYWSPTAKPTLKKSSGS